jgi:hypothetical protein
MAAAAAEYKHQNHSKGRLNSSLMPSRANRLSRSKTKLSNLSTLKAAPRTLLLLLLMYPRRVTNTMMMMMMTATAAQKSSNRTCRTL